MCIFYDFSLTSVDTDNLIPFKANMKVITAIYLHCRPDLRDEWLTGVDIDSDVEESLVNFSSFILSLLQLMNLIRLPSASRTSFASSSQILQHKTLWIFCSSLTSTFIGSKSCSRIRTIASSFSRRFRR